MCIYIYIIHTYTAATSFPGQSAQDITLKNIKNLLPRNCPPKKKSSKELPIHSSHSFQIMPIYLNPDENFKPTVLETNFILCFDFIIWYIIYIFTYIKRRISFLYISLAFTYRIPPPKKTYTHRNRFLIPFQSERIWS